MHFRNVRIEALGYALPERVMTSADIEDDLAEVYERLKLPAGRLELMTGIRERRFWPVDYLPSQASAQAGESALAQSTFDRGAMDMVIHAAVCRDRLEPATASYVHRLLRLSPDCQIFDVSNACLGFLNAMVLAAGLIDAGQVRRVLICSGENGYPLLRRTLEQLKAPELTRKTIKPYFANLTIGAGAVAAVLCHKDEVDRPLPALACAAVETDTSQNELCQGDSSGSDALEMMTDSEELLVAGLAVADRAWQKFLVTSGWERPAIARFICHQVGKRHRDGLFARLAIPVERDFSTFETLGNVGSVSCPITLVKAAEADAVAPGDRVALLGIGSGLSSVMLGLEWEALS